MARPDFRGQAAQRLSEERAELSPAIISLLRPDESRRGHQVHPQLPVDRIDANPNQPRLTFDEETLQELAASITRARRPPADPGPARGLDGTLPAHRR